MDNMKKIISILAAMAVAAAPIMALADGISVVLNGSAIEFDVPPQIINERTMVPLRAIFEALGASVEWDGDTRTVTSQKGGTMISLAIDSPIMYVNGSEITLDQPACIVDERTLVPVRAISEAYDLAVDWDGDTRTVYIWDTDKESNRVRSGAFDRIAAEIIRRDDSGGVTGAYKVTGTVAGFDGELSIWYIPDTNELYFVWYIEYNGGMGEYVNLLAREDGTGAVSCSMYIDKKYSVAYYYSEGEYSLEDSDIEGNDADFAQLINSGYEYFDEALRTLGIDAALADIGITEIK